MSSLPAFFAVFVLFASDTSLILDPCLLDPDACLADIPPVPFEPQGQQVLRDWPQFSPGIISSDITRENVGQLALRWRVTLPATVEGSPLYASQILSLSSPRDLLIVATVNGRLIALDAATGEKIWATTPPEGPRWTTSSPALDPNRTSVYVYGLDGYIHKHSVRTGAEVRNESWPALVTRKGSVEKGSALSIATVRSGESYLYMTTAGYPDPGDAGDYQGHLVTINLSTGAQHIFNAACSDRETHFVENGDPSTDCENVQSGIWARAGAVYDRRTNRVFVSTGNGVFDADRGGFNWGSSVVALRPDGSTDGGTPLDTYTPSNHQQLTDKDLDLSSTTVAPLETDPASGFPPLAVQGGKDSKLRLLDLSNLSGDGGPRHVGGELELLDVPQGGEVMTRPAVWLDSATSCIAIATQKGMSAFKLIKVHRQPALARSWMIKDGCTSPIYANGMLFCARTGSLVARDARTGRELWRDTNVGAVHWQSPIVVGSSVYIADSEGLNAYSLPDE